MVKCKDEDYMENTEVMELLEGLGVLEYNESVHEKDDLWAVIYVHKEIMDKNTLDLINRVFLGDFDIIPYYCEQPDDLYHTLHFQIEEGKKDD